MRILSLIVFVVLVAAILIFAFQNMQAVSVRFLDFTLDAPMAAVAIALYLLGMLTGSSLVGALRRSWSRYRER
jgi:uncharacterized integral membrane protein